MKEPVAGPEAGKRGLILHGRSGIKENYLAVAERFCAVGMRCIIPDLPGHGSNPDPFTTYGVLEAPMILKCYDEVAGKYGFAGQPCGILGQSMGGAEAIHTAVLDGSPFGALVVVSTFDKLETVKLDAQSITATAGTRQKPVKLEITKADDSFSLPTPGEGEWIIMQYKETADSKPITARLHFNTLKCEPCSNPEWRCACGKKK